MFIDLKNIFSRQSDDPEAYAEIIERYFHTQDIPRAVGTTSLNHFIDVGEGREWGLGYPAAALYVVIPTAPTSDGVATICLQLLSSDSPTLTAPSVVLDVFGTIPYNSPKIGSASASIAALPRATPSATRPRGWQRFIGFTVTIGVAPLTGGSISAFLARGDQDAALQRAGFRNVPECIPEPRNHPKYQETNYAR